MDSYRYPGLLPMFTHLVILINIYTSYVMIFSVYIGIITSINKQASINYPKRNFLPNHEKLYKNLLFTYLLLKELITILVCTWLYLFLLLAGDVHKNPGPNSTSSSNLETLSGMAHHLSFVHLNVQSIRHKLDILHAELKHFDILAFSESWLNNSVSSDDLMLPSYSCPERKDRICDTHGGVILYVRENLHYKRRYDLELNRVECIWIELILENNKHVLFGLFYRPPNADAYYNCNIEDSIALAVDTNISDIIVTGDFNYDALNINSNRKITSINQQFNMEQLITEPTHFTESSQSLIDLIFVSNQNNLIESGVGDHFLDQEHRVHLPVFGLLKFRKPIQNKFKRTVWEYNRGDYDKLRQDFHSVNWQNCINNDIDIYAQNITNQIIQIAKNNIPNKRIVVRPLDAPWMTNIVRRHIRKRKRIFRKARQTQSQYQWQKFRQVRNETIKFIREAKSNYYSKLSDKLKQGSLLSSDWWKTLKTFISSKQTTSIPPLKNPETEDLNFTDVDKANLLNDYFIKQTYIDNSDKPVPDLGPAETVNTLPRITIDAAEIEDVLRSLKTDKASGPDGISNRILREASHELSQPLCDLFNTSLLCRKVPSIWKEAHVTAIFKKGDSSLPSNYRPISLLNTIEKVFERLIFKRLFNHLKDNRFLTPVQSGFIPGDSTVNQLVLIYETLCKALDNGLEARVIFFDISKAFDKVWHKGILLKLRHTGVCEDLYDWFKDYLSNRRQRVVLSNVKSSWGNISAGVPQGSILGPLLFLIFINDIVLNLQSNVNLFADDTSLYLVVENPVTAAQQLQRDIQSISTWADKWLVTFNPSKSESLVVTRKQMLIILLYKCSIRIYLKYTIINTLESFFHTIATGIHTSIT